MESEPFLEEVEPPISQFIDDTINAIGMGRYQWRLFYLSGLGWMVDNMQIQAVAIILPQIALEYSLKGAQIGILSSATLVGMMLGGLFWGYVADIVGRNASYKLPLLFASVFGILASFSTSFTLICFNFAILGFGVGGSLPCDGAMLIDLLPKQNHSLLTLLSIFWAFGQIVASVLAIFLMPGFSCIVGSECTVEKNIGWRYLQLSISIITLSIVTCRTFSAVYESPRLLVSLGKNDEAFRILEDLSGLNNVDFPESTSRMYESRNSINPNSRIKYDLSHLSCLFEKEMIGTTVILWLIWGTTTFAYTIFNNFLPLFIAEYVIDTKEIYIRYLIFSIFGIPGSILGMFLSDSKVGRKGTMSAAALGTALFVLLFSVLANKELRLIASCGVSLLQNAMYGVIYSYSPEVFPLKVRGTAVGIAAALGRIAGSIAPLITGWLLSNFGLAIPLYLSSFLFLITSILMVSLPIETRQELNSI